MKSDEWRSSVIAPQTNDGDLPLLPSRRGENLYMVPQGIRPVVQLTAIEVNNQAIQLLSQAA